MALVASDTLTDVLLSRAKKRTPIASGEVAERTSENEAMRAQILSLNLAVEGMARQIANEVT